MYFFFFQKLEHTENDKTVFFRFFCAHQKRHAVISFTVVSGPSNRQKHKNLCCKRLCPNKGTVPVSKKTMRNLNIVETLIFILLVASGVYIVYKFFSVANTGDNPSSLTSATGSTTSVAPATSATIVGQECKEGSGIFCPNSCPYCCFSSGQDKYYCTSKPSGEIDNCFDSSCGTPAARK